MLGGIRSWFVGLWWSARHSTPVASVPWSAIRRIGQSRLLALTIIVPFLGSLLLFNQHVVDLLTLSPELVGRWTKTPGSDGDYARTLTFSRLYYLYFGLCFLGIGSAMFALTCPLEIKSHSSAREYLEVEGPLVTRARMGLLLPTIASHFNYWEGEENPHSYGLLGRFASPSAFLSLYCQVVIELYNAAGSGVEEPPPPPPDPTAEDAPDLDDEYEDDFLDHRGSPDPYKIANVIYVGHRMHRGFNYAIQEIAGTEAHRKDILTLHYMALDHSKPRLRILVASFYALGFATLLWPTGLTFVQLSASLLAR